MNRLRLRFCKKDIEKVTIIFAMTCMEGLGIVMLICGIFGIKIF
jgi:hypothetical protein